MGFVSLATKSLLKAGPETLSLYLEGLGSSQCSSSVDLSTGLCAGDSGFMSLCSLLSAQHSYHAETCLGFLIQVKGNCNAISNTYILYYYVVTVWVWPTYGYNGQVYTNLWPYILQSVLCLSCMIFQYSLYLLFLRIPVKVYITWCYL